MPSDSQTATVPVSEAAVRLRVSREKLIRMIQRGEIGGGQLGGRLWFVHGDALATAIAGQKKVTRRSA